MDRRAFLISTGWFPATFGAGWTNAAHDAYASERGHLLAVVDSTQPLGAAFERYAAKINLPVFDIGSKLGSDIGGDIGELWHTTLAPLLTSQTSMRGAPWLIGVTRASDYFVLQELATHATHRLNPNLSQRITHGCVSFAFAPR